jgi:regulatory protein
VPEGPPRPEQPSLAEEPHTESLVAATSHDPAHDQAMARAGRLLALRPRTERELRDRLAEAGCSPGVVDGALARLAELGLVDDAAFAHQWVEERSRRGLAGAALIAELTAKGVAQDVAGAAVTDAALDDAAQARALAARHVGRLADLPLLRQAARLQALLARRGYSNEVAAEATRSVLPPEGWD